MTCPCPLCAKVAASDQLPAGEVVWTFPQSVAFLGPWQYYHGYCVLVSRRHARELGELPEDVRRAYFEEMCQLAAAIERAFQPRKLNYELLGNQVPHPHWHLFPRYESDPERLKPVWIALDRAETDAAEKARLETGTLSRPETAAAIRRQLEAAEG